MEDLKSVIQRYKSEPSSVYNTWFISSADRLKAFRAISEHWPVSYRVIAAANDRTKTYKDGRLAEFSLQTLPELNVAPEILNTIKLIDILWLDAIDDSVIAAFEVEKTGDSGQ